MSLAETRSHIPIPRTVKKVKKKRWIPKVTPERAAANREYSKRRKAYLIAHPYCMIFIKLKGLKEEEVIRNNGLVWIPNSVYGSAKRQVPIATEIHHSRKPKKTYLNDESTWFAASREYHEWAENHKNLARELGVLHNI